MNVDDQTLNRMQAFPAQRSEINQITGQIKADSESFEAHPEDIRKRVQSYCQVLLERKSRRGGGERARERERASERESGRERERERERKRVREAETESEREG